MVKITYKMFQNYKWAHDKNLKFSQFLSLFVPEIYTEIYEQINRIQGIKH